MRRVLINHFFWIIFYFLDSLNGFLGVMSLLLYYTTIPNHKVSIGIIFRIHLFQIQHLQYIFADFFTLQCYFIGIRPIFFIIEACIFLVARGKLKSSTNCYRNLCIESHWLHEMYVFHQSHFLKRKSSKIVIKKIVLQ